MATSKGNTSGGSKSAGRNVGVRKGTSVTTAPKTKVTGHTEGFKKIKPKVTGTAKVSSPKRSGVGSFRKGNG